MEWHEFAKHTLSYLVLLIRYIKKMIFIPIKVYVLKRQKLRILFYFQLSIFLLSVKLVLNYKEYFI